MKPKLKIGSLFSGVAGLDRAVEQFFDAEVAFFVEWEKAPSKVLAYRYPGVPNYGDVLARQANRGDPMTIEYRKRGTIPHAVSPNFRLLLLQCAGSNATLADEFVDWTEDTYICGRKFEIEAEPADLFKEFLGARNRAANGDAA